MAAAVAMQQASGLQSSFCGASLKQKAAVSGRPQNVAFAVRAAGYDEELIKTARTIASPGRGILAIDESNATCGKRLASIGLENNEVNRQAYRQLLCTTPGLGEYISGAIMFEETLYQSTSDGKKMVDCLVEGGIVPGIKVDKGLVPLAGSNEESWCQGLDGLASRTAAYYKQGARFAKWRTVVSIPNGPSDLAVTEAAWGLARYAAICQDTGLVPIVEPEVLLDGSHGIDRTLEVAEKVWSKVFYYLGENNVLLEGILLKPSMVTPGAECPERATPEQVAEYTLKMLRRRVPPAVPGIMVIFVRRAVGGGGDAEPECDEPEPEPMACVVLVREGAAELGVEDVEGATREPGGGEEGIAGEGEGELVGAAGEVLSRGRGQGSEGGDVREGLHILRRTED
ncbi:fructose-bisphosphate aldolase 1, chloroplastic isoform X2 [Physcomitrium patens]|uniref:fructose-bisphosphate aldolase 1, chloroplastic isoform X2 n=1 Tax=Physcomitrium patens TaxID=3218 RepID=UPI003CCE13E5